MAPLDARMRVIEHFIARKSTTKQIEKSLFNETIYMDGANASYACFMTFMPSRRVLRGPLQPNSTFREFNL